MKVPNWSKFVVVIANLVPPVHMYFEDVADGELLEVHLSGGSPQVLGKSTHPIIGGPRPVQEIAWTCMGSTSLKSRWFHDTVGLQHWL